MNDFERYIRTTGRRVRILRQDVGWSQDDLADAVAGCGYEISRANISKIERDAVQPSGAAVAALAKALGTTADYLLMLSDVATERDESPPPLSGEALEIGRMFDSLPASRQRDLMIQARIYAVDRMTAAGQVLALLDAIGSEPGLLDELSRIIEQSHKRNGGRVSGYWDEVG